MFKKFSWTGPDKAGTIVIGLAGPQKSPVFKIGAGTLVKHVTWGANGLKVQLQQNAKPVIVVQEGALILQVQETTIKKDGFLFWSAHPDGIFVRDWMKSAEEKPSFETFVSKHDKESKKLVSGSQTFHLRPVVRELIVVADEIELFAAPNDNSQSLSVSLIVGIFANLLPSDVSMFRLNTSYAISVPAGLIELPFFSLKENSMKYSNLANLASSPSLIIGLGIETVMVFEP